jgi:hypothetical protein
MKIASPDGRRLLGAAKSKRVIALGVGVVAITTAGAFAAVVGQNAAPAVLPPAASAGNQPASPPMPAGFVEFQHPTAGFALSYPADWARLDSGDPQVPLLVQGGPHSFLVRVMDLPTQVGPRELPAAKPFTDQVVMSNGSVKLIAEPQQITLAGLPGYFYFYSFTDPASGAAGAHSHFFLFKGTTMISIVFQTVPAEQFGSGAATFDQVTRTFRVF